MVAVVAVAVAVAVAVTHRTGPRVPAARRDMEEPQARLVPYPRAAALSAATRAAAVALVVVPIRAVQVPMAPVRITAILAMRAALAPQEATVRQAATVTRALTRACILVPALAAAVVVAAAETVVVTAAAAVAAAPPVERAAEASS